MKTETEKNWGAEPWRAPALADGDTLIYDECGRGIRDPRANYGVCYRSHYFRLVRAEFGGYFLLVKHGGGEERIKFGHKRLMIEGLAMLDSDTRYLVLHQFLDLIHEAERAARAQTAAEYRSAFSDGRLKKRKIRGQNAAKVWIEPKQVQS